MKEVFGKYGVLIAFGMLFAISAVWQPTTFLSPDNLKNLINQNVDIGILAVGMTFVVITGGIDLSVGSMIALIGGVGLTCLNALLGRGLSDTSACLITLPIMLALGALAGAFQGVVVAYGRVAPFIVTLIGMLAFRSLTQTLANSGEIRSGSADVWSHWGTGGIEIPFMHDNGGRPFLLTFGMIIFVAVILIASFILNKTRYGRYAIALGANERATRYSAVPVERIKVLTYVISGIAVAIAAVVLSGRMGAVNSGGTGTTYELDAIAAVVIGGTSLRGGFGRIWGTVVGVLMLGVINNMLIFAGVNTTWQGVVKGVVILLAVLLQREKREI